MKNITEIHVGSEPAPRITTKYAAVMVTNITEAASIHNPHAPMEPTGVKPNAPKTSRTPPTCISVMINTNACYDPLKTTNLQPITGNASAQSMNIVLPINLFGAAMGVASPAHLIISKTVNAVLDMLVEP